jgi:hypothetical protein
MAKIFISYARADRDVVEELVEDLRDDDHEVWFDQHLTGGQKWWDDILTQIRSCDIFIAALTPEFLEARPCQKQVKYASHLQRLLLPIRCSDKVLPDSLSPTLSQLQWVDYSVRDKEALKNLLRALRHLPNPPPLPDPLPGAPPIPVSYLTSLRENVESISLTLQDQIALVFELRQQFRQGVPANEILELLQRLKNRDDLRATIREDIDDMLREVSATLPNFQRLTRFSSVIGVKIADSLPEESLTGSHTSLAATLYSWI